MTRINLITPALLSDQHLLAEYRELPRVFWLVRKQLLKGKKIESWLKYTMGTGHVKFFYDKLWFLAQRLESLIWECQKRGFKITFREKIDLSQFPIELQKNFVPSDADLAISRQRIKEKLDQKSDFYTFYGEKIDQKQNIS